jgi:hypothetical protein
MKAKLVRTGKPMSLSSPQFFFAQDRATADEAYAGDVVGIPNHGTLRIGDTLTEGEDITFIGVPNFAPEIVRRVRLGDAMKAKKLKEALQQMAEEGVVQVFRPRDGSPAMVGVVGALQLDVLKERLIDPRTISGVGAFGRAGLRTVRVNFVPPSTSSQTYCTTIGPVTLICVRPIHRRGRSQAITSQSSATGPDRVDQCS